MKKWQLTVVLGILALFAIPASAQTTESPKVCISPDAAKMCLANSDLVEAQKKQIAVLDQAILDLKAEVLKMQIEVAKLTGEKTGLEKQAVRDAAIIEMLLQNVKKKRNAFITLF